MIWKTNQWFPEVGLGKSLTLKVQHEGVVQDEGALWILTVVVQLLSHVQLFVTPWTTAHLPFTVSWSLLKLMSIELMMPSNHLILCCPLLLASIFHIIRVFFNESILCISWPKYWSISISPSNDYSGLISFRIDWVNLLAVQETLKSLVQHHNSKTIMVKLSYLYMTTCICLYMTNYGGRDTNPHVGKFIELYPK